MNFTSIDTALFVFLNKGIQNPLFDVLMPFLTEHAPLLFLPVVAWFFFREKEKILPLLAVAVLAVFFADGTGNVLKHLVARPRPCQVLSNIHLLAGCGSSYSMPSNHAVNTFAFAMVFWLTRKDLGSLIMVLTAALIGISRVYVGVHYPFDVAVGAVLGSACAWVFIRFARWAKEIYRKRDYTQALLLLILVAGLFRIYYILTGPFDLSFDEAQYWEWSRRLDWSYYSKGPLIAYLIYLGTSLFGNNVFGVRIFAVLFSALSSGVIFIIGRDLYDERTGLVSALLVQIVPLYSVFGMLLTIDSPFMFLWILSLFLFWRAAGPPEEKNGRGSDGYWLLLGISTGLGMLAKYTMAFFCVSAVFFMVFHKGARKLFRARGPYIALAVSLAVFSPVIFWNAAHGWVTLKHTAGQAHLAEGLRISWKHFFEFLGSQLGVLTPILCVMVLISLRKMKKDKAGDFLFWFSVPIIVFFVLKSIQGKVQGNWALPAYATGYVAFAAYYFRNMRRVRKSVKILAASALVLAFAVTVFAYVPSILNLPLKLDPAKKLQGWKELGAAASRVQSEMSSAGPLFIFSDSYEISSELAFYMKGNPVTYCVNLGRRMNQYDLWPGFGNLLGYNAIFVVGGGDGNMPEPIAKSFGGYAKEVVSVHIRNRKIMKFTVFKCYDFKGIKLRPAETY
jgi:membrane-associated phospholipid phosphatase